jgi:hypothetical protein
VTAVLWWIAVAAVFLPAVLLALSEMSPNIRAARHGLLEVNADTPRIENFAVIVPIYGNIRYLENIDYLSQYGHRVWLTTTSVETPEFFEAIDAIAAQHGFNVFRGEVPGRQLPGQSDKKSNTGVVREIIVRDVLHVIEAPYVVCIDADTDTELPLSILVGALEQGRFDLASVRLVAKNRDNLMERLQAHEYRNAMRLRYLMPWLVSGACHVLRTRVHREIMDRHSTFFQGNDVEVGVLGDALSYRVGHIPFDVPTTVPSTFKAWFRQRLAWSGGEARLFVVNLYLARWHPTLFIYGFLALVTTPLRWWFLIDPSWPVAVAVATYLLVMGVVNWPHRDRALLVMPFYLLLISLVIVPMGVVMYLKMVRSDHKVGMINPGERHRPVRPERRMRVAPAGAALPVDLVAAGRGPQLR